jgi:enoyl-CoA hydratase/carnithine racemase
MSDLGDFADIGVEMHGHVAVVEIQRPPFNFFDMDLIRQIASAFEGLDADGNCRAIVLAAEGKAFCAGANFSNDSGDQVIEGGNDNNPAGHLYQEAVRLFRCTKPVVGAIQGAAIGGGLGLALVPDFRVACPESRFAANFTRLGFHPGFGLTHTLPRVIGQQKAAMMFYTSRRLKGEEALEIGLADVLVPLEDIRQTAIDFAAEIAENSPLGVVETRGTMRQGLAEQVKAATDRELEIQSRLKDTEDFGEGVAAMAERRVPNFQGR